MNQPLLIIGNRNYSSWSLRAWSAMRKSGVSFDVRRLPLDTPEFRDEIPDLSPTHRVPALWHRANCIWDSLAICEYANEQFAQGELLPRDVGDRAWARSVSAEMHAGFAAVRNAMPMNLRARGRRVATDAAVQADLNRAFSIWTQCRTAHASKGPWLFGDFSIADAMYIPLVLRLPTYGVTMPVVVSEYLATVESDDDIAQWVREGLEETEIVEADEAG